MRHSFKVLNYFPHSKFPISHSPYPPRALQNFNTRMALVIFNVKSLYVKANVFDGWIGFR